MLFYSGILAQSKEFLPELSLENNTKYFDSAFCFISQDNNIFFRKWEYPNSGKAENVLLIIHGLGFYGDPYRKIMDHQNTNEIIVYSMDLRGHGFSGKERGCLESNEMILSDIGKMVEIIAADNPGTKLFLLGSSMGGLYALAYLFGDTTNLFISGLIIPGVALSPHRSQIYRPGNISYLFPMIFDPSKPVVYLDGNRLEMSSSSEQYITSRREDSCSLHYVSIDYLHKIRHMQIKARKKDSLAMLSLPILIQHGGKDKITDLTGSFYLMNNLINCDRELIIYPESRHSLLWEPECVNVIRDLMDWILKSEF